jgi:hypothetical protein
LVTAIKLLHTVIWAILAGSIVVLPLAGVFRRFRLAAILTGFVLLECGVLALNRGRCPLSDLAQHFTADSADNFDIYLPNWLARYNKGIFGVLFIAGELVVLGYWLAERPARKRQRRDVESRKEAIDSISTQSEAANAAAANAARHGPD